MKYNSAQVEAFYDAYGEKEWNRLTKDPLNRISFYIYQHYLQKYVAADDLVLEVGAGAGRFTIELAKLKARITVGDLSGEQLKLNPNYLSVNHNELLKQNPQLLERADFLQWELDFSAEDGCVDGGTHIITVVKKV